MDDLSFDDLIPDEPQGQDQQPTQSAQQDVNFDDLTFDDLIPRPKSESGMGSFVREAANAVGPGAVGAGVGGALGGAVAGAVGGPVGAVAGFGAGLAGGLGAGYLADKAQEYAKETVGLGDAEQRAANAQEHPYLTAAGQVVGNIATMKFDKAATAASRLIGAGVMGGVEGGQQAAEGKFDPARLALNVAAGAVFTNPNKVGEKIQSGIETAAKKFVPGRPGAQPNPAAGQAQQQANPQPQNSNANTLGTANTAAPPNTNTNTVGQGGMGTTTGTRNQGKNAPPSSTATVTTGDIAPDVAAATAPRESWLRDDDGTPATQDELRRAQAAQTNREGGLDFTEGAEPQQGVQTGAPEPQAAPAAQQAGNPQQNFPDNPPIQPTENVPAAPRQGRPGRRGRQDQPGEAPNTSRTVVDINGDRTVIDNHQVTPPSKPVEQWTTAELDAHPSEVFKRTKKFNKLYDAAAAREQGVSRETNQAQTPEPTVTNAPAGKNEPTPAPAISTNNQLSPSKTEASVLYSPDGKPRIDGPAPTTRDEMTAHKSILQKELMDGPRLRKIARERKMPVDKVREQVRGAIESINGDIGAGDLREATGKTGKTGKETGREDLSTVRAKTENNVLDMQHEGEVLKRKRAIQKGVFPENAPRVDDEPGTGWKDPKYDKGSKFDANGKPYGPDNPNPTKPKGSKPKPVEDEGLVFEGESEVPEKVQDLLERSPQETNHAPTEGQKDAGNYKKAGGRVLGREFKVETAKGEVRRSPEGVEPKWENVSPADYGYFRGTKGADSKKGKVEAIDGYVDGTGNKHFVVDQRDPATGKFDEHKVIAHTSDEARAREIYNEGFSDGSGPERMGAITEVPEQELKDWLPKGWKKKPYSKEWQDTEPTRAVTVPVKAEAPPKENPLVIKGVTNDDGTPVHANTVPEARKAERDIEKMHDEFGKAMADPALQNDNLINSMSDKKARQSVMAALKKFAGATMNLYKPVNGHEGHELRQQITDLNGKTGQDKEDAYQTLASNIVMMRAGEPVKEVRQQRRIEADTGLNQRTALDELPDELHPVSEGKEAEAGLDFVGDHENEPHAAIDEPKPTPLLKREDGKYKPGKVLERVEPKKKSARRNELPALDIDGDGAKAGQELGKALDVDNVTKAKPVWQRATTKEPPRKAAEVKKFSTEDIAKINEQLKAEPLTTGDVKTNKTLRDVLSTIGRDKKGGLDLDAVIDAIKSGAGKVGSGISKAEAAIGRAVESMVGKRSTVDSARAGPLFRKVTKEYDAAQNLDERYAQARKNDTSHIVELLQAAKKLAKLFTKDERRRIFDTRDEGKMQHLDPALQQKYDIHLKPLFENNDQLFKDIQALDPDKIGPQVTMDHVMHLPEGSLGKKYKDIFGKNDDPISGVSGFSTQPKGSAMERTFKALENNKTGKRWVIHVNDDGFTIHNNRKTQRVTDHNFKYEPNGKLEFVDNNGNIHKFTMGDATVAEKEQHAVFGNGQNAKYYHDALLSAVLTNYHLGRMKRNLELMQNLKNDPEFKRMATSNTDKALDHWIGTKHPNFEHWKMEPALAHVMDQYAKPGFENFDGFRNLAQAVTKTIFWNPIPHIGNVGAHWFVEKGFDWLKPTTYHSLAVDGAKAIHSVITQSPLQKELADAGMGGVYRSIISKDALQKVAKQVGIQIEKDPKSWSAVADKFGLGVPQLARAIYNGSSRTMWAVNDMLLTQAVLQKQRQHGMSMEAAIKDVERHIPNYRIAADVMGSRGLSKVLEDPALIAFGRYHAGVFNSFANMAKDLVKGNVADKMHAVGNIMAMAVGAYFIYPQLDKAAKYITGNDTATVRRRGPWAVGSHIKDAANNINDAATVLQNSVTLSPLLSTGLKGVYENRDFRGKPVLDKGTMSAAMKGDGGAAARAAGQVGGYLATNLVSPVGTAMNAYNASAGAKKGESTPGYIARRTGETVRNQVLDIKDPSAKAQKYEAQADRKAAQETRTRLRHPSNPIEKGVNWLTGK